MPCNSTQLVTQLVTHIYQLIQLISHLNNSINILKISLYKISNILFQSLKYSSYGLLAYAFDSSNSDCNL